MINKTNNMSNPESLRKEIELQFQELFERAIEIYPDINETISISKTFTESNEEFNEYINLLNQIPQQTSTNQFILD
jgi:glycine cleavage system protein P-like pyridoxal-binding family